MVDAALAACIPQNKHDLAAVNAAACLGFPAINPILPQLLAWLQDANWPVAAPIFVLLGQSGPEIAPHLISILRSDDAVWAYWIMDQLVSHLPAGTRALIADDIARIAANPTPAQRHEQVDLAAQRVVAQRD
jgi:hypothetical protein